MSRGSILTVAIAAVAVRSARAWSCNTGSVTAAWCNITSAQALPATLLVNNLGLGPGSIITCGFASGCTLVALGSVSLRGATVSGTGPVNFSAAGDFFTSGGTAVRVTGASSNTFIASAGGTCYLSSTTIIAPVVALQCTGDVRLSAVRVSADALGYPQGVGPGAGGAGTSSPNNCQDCACSAGGGGGGHGGAGGIATAYAGELPGAVGGSYGSTYAPITPGSGGGAGYPGAGGAGGGVVTLASSSGTVSLTNGTWVTADGGPSQDAFNVCAGWTASSGGGGAGGSLFIVAAGAISGDASSGATARGGNSYAGAQGGAGGGGRVALACATAPALHPLFTLSASGGTASLVVPFNIAVHFYLPPGENGSVVMRTLATPPPTPTTSVTASPSALPRCLGAPAFSCSGGGSLDDVCYVRQAQELPVALVGASFVVQPGALLCCSAPAGCAITATVGSISISSAAVVSTSSLWLNAAGNVTLKFANVSALGPLAQLSVLSRSGACSLTSSSLLGANVSVACAQRVDLAGGSNISADGMGYSTGGGPGAGGNAASAGCADCACSAGGGGGAHGGPGGNASSYIYVAGAGSTATYGNASAPASFGSGGGLSIGCGRVSRGGGIVSVRTEGALSLLDRSRMSANGEVVRACHVCSHFTAVAAGGGAGGSVAVVAGSLLLGSAAAILADGGWVAAGMQAGAGGGGRVMLAATTTAFTIPSNATVTANGGGVGPMALVDGAMLAISIVGLPGSAGTVRLVQPPSVSPTVSLTVTPTRTASLTSTPSPSGTVTRSGTASQTGTPTPSATGTRSGTASLTGTSSPSTTGSSTGTRSGTASLTGTPSPSATDTCTKTGSLTGTSSSSATGSSTGTSSSSGTGSATSTPSPSATSSGSGSSTGTTTPTDTPPHSGTGSRTRSATGTGSRTRTASGTGTRSRSGSATPRRTLSPTSTRSSTSTGSLTPTFTPNPTRYPPRNCGRFGWPDCTTDTPSRSRMPRGATVSATRSRKPKLRV